MLFSQKLLWLCWFDSGDEEILPTSFGTDRKETKPLSKVIALDLQSERNQQLVF